MRGGIGGGGGIGRGGIGRGGIGRGGIGGGGGDCTLNEFLRCFMLFLLIYNNE